MLKIVISFVIFILVQNLTFAQDMNHSIVKVHVSKSRWDYSSPWQKKGVSTSSGSGCVIEGNFILTNAHVVSNNIFIQVQFAANAKKYKAEAKYINDAADLALLEVEDSKYHEICKPLEFDTIPNILDEITVYGFPIGGEEMCITKGRVSRMEFVRYAHSYEYLPSGQVDATVTYGNSGGPIMKDGKIVGIVMQGSGYSKYFVPTVMIKQFLKDISDDRLDGIPNDHFYYQKMENEDLRRKYSLPDSLSGVLVNRISEESPCKDLLKVGDIIIKEDSYDLDNDGKIEFRPGERINVNLLLHSKQINDMLTYTVFRDKEIIEVPVKLTKDLDDASILPIPEHNKQPSYYTLAGFVFQPLTHNLRYSYGYGTNVNSITEEEKKDIDEFVILTTVFPSELSHGYERVKGMIMKVNNQKVTSLEHFISLIENTDSEFYTLELKGGLQIVLEKDKVEERNDKILEINGISSDRSPDLR